MGVRQAGVCVGGAREQADSTFLAARLRGSLMGWESTLMQREQISTNAEAAPGSPPPAELQSGLHGGCPHRPHTHTPSVAARIR